MLKYTDYDIVFQEIPDEITLAINLSNCPHRCQGCHSPYLQRDAGEEMNERALSVLFRKYAASITCICFMGGDAMPREVQRLSEHIKKTAGGRIKTAWYSGCDNLESGAARTFDYIKLGPYIESLGGLDKKTTNQRLYRITNGELTDITPSMQRQVF